MIYDFVYGAKKGFCISCSILLQHQRDIEVKGNIKTKTMDDFKPAGYNSVSPYLVVNGAQRMIDLLKKVFNVQDLRKYETPDGKIMHSEVRLDDSVIMIADATEMWPQNQSLLHVYVADVDAIYRKAIDAGCEAGEQPKERDGDPDRRGGFRDFAGNYWSVSTQVARK